MMEPKISHQSLLVMALTLVMTLAVTTAAPRGTLSRAPPLRSQNSAGDRTTAEETAPPPSYLGFRVPKLAIDHPSGDESKNIDNFYPDPRVPILAEFDEVFEKHSGAPVAVKGSRSGAHVPPLASDVSDAVTGSGYRMGVRIPTIAV